MKKIVFLDTETTGLTSKYGIIQVAGIIDINFQTKQKFDILMSPFPGDMISAKALEVNKRTVEEIKTFQSSAQGKEEFCSVLSGYCNKFDKSDKMYMVGYNVEFDHMMIGAWFKKNGDNYLMSWFNYPVIDVAQMAAIHMEITDEKSKLVNFKLGTLGVYLGLIEDESELHNAMADIALTRDIFYVMLKAMGNYVPLIEVARQYKEENA